MLTSFFIGEYNQKLEKAVNNISAEVMECFLNYNWPGNVRELEHVVECAMVVMGNEVCIKLKHLPRHLIACYAQKVTPNSGIDEFRKLPAQTSEKKTRQVLKHQLDNTEKELITNILGKTSGNVSETARMLGISRQSLQYRMRKYDIKRGYTL
jgi:arginine utilization regulatory protein